MTGSTFLRFFSVVKNCSLPAVTSCAEPQFGQKMRCV
jgi:hypothetical protein